MMNLVTDNPESTMDFVFNIAFCKDKEVWIREGGLGDCTLVDLEKRLCNQCKFCGEKDEVQNTFDLDAFGEIIQECSAEGCPAAHMYFVAIQAAELRERLRMYEERDGDLSGKNAES